MAAAGPKTSVHAVPETSPPATPIAVPRTVATSRSLRSRDTGLTGWVAWVGAASQLASPSASPKTSP